MSSNLTREYISILRNRYRRASIPNEDALIYDRTIGLFTGASVGGFAIAQGRLRNRAVYGEEFGTPDYILNLNGKSSPEIVMPFVRALNRYFP